MCSNVIASQTCKVCAVCARTDPYCCLNISIIGRSAAEPARRAPLGRGALRTGGGRRGPASRRLCASRGCAQPPPRSGGLALTQLREALIPGRSAARFHQRAGTAPLPGRGRSPPSPSGRGAARGGRWGASAESWALARHRRRSLLGIARVAASPCFGLGVGNRGVPFTG